MAEPPAPPSPADERFGLVVLDEVQHLAVRNGCVRTAQALRRVGCRTIGLLPASDKVSVVPIGIQLAVSLAALSSTRIGIIDANARAPLFGATFQSRHDGEEYATRWLTTDVALVVPPRPDDGSAGVAQLRKTLRAALDRFGYLFVDLTGLQRYGDHIAAANVLEGVIIVAVAGLTREAELEILARDVPEARQLGVLLIGGEDE